MLGRSRRPGADKLKVGFIYVGPVGDFGWTYQHDVGRQDLEGIRRQGRDDLSRERGEGPDAERVIEQLARTGSKLIFTTSFGFMDPTLKVAKQFPKVKFEHATGYKRAQTSRPTTPASTRAATSGPDRGQDVEERACSAISARSRSPRW